MSRLINFSTIGEAHNAPRYWLEGARLASLGFDAEQPLSVRVDALRVVVERAATSGRAVSFRRCAGVAGGRMPILDLNSAAIMGGLTSLVFCIVGAIAIALGEAVVTIFMQPRYAHAIPVIILLLLLVVRPSGLAGQTEQIERV